MPAGRTNEPCGLRTRPSERGLQLNRFTLKFLGFLCHCASSQPVRAGHVTSGTSATSSAALAGAAASNDVHPGSIREWELQRKECDFINSKPQTLMGSRGEPAG
ncbi:hypothetical protein AV530_006805 [Patagioenas fasciata monilis]|uniref:Uncharacterized protein n=1 Tax=Patagioenas fasciata monilis TaxID=372326 RepID=A0A1V4KQI2_PATFA|nr:hypothetical protein AV530_006805 [Patagioenas fasciata monilis]